MSRMVWDAAFSVKVDEIDEQHRRWIEIINELHDTLMVKGGGGRITERILAEMLDYTNFHFTFEEDYLQRIGYPGLDQHRLQHRYFLDTVLGKLQEEQSGGLVLNTEVMRLLTVWLRDHILTEDRKYMLFNQSQATERGSA